MAVSPDHTNIGFHYPPLHPSRREFRVFTFHGLDELGLLHGRLNAVSLTNTDLQYIALSYEWGDDAPRHTIIVNDHSFRIRNNLYNFLSSVAHQGRPQHPVFIDALCINQADRGERSSQVSLMPEIYSHAVEVRAWLGPLPAWWTTWPRLSDLRRTVEKREWGNFMLYFLNSRMPGKKKKLCFSFENVTDWANDSGLDVLTIIAARVAAQRPFWKRLWIVQELLLARELTIHLGDRVLAPETVMRVSRAMSGYLDQDVAAEGLKSVVPDRSGGTVNDYFFDSLRFQNAAIILSRKYSSAASGLGVLPLPDLLEAFAMQQCREPRDHIFGLLGLSSSALWPDYDIHMPQLFLYALLEAYWHTQRNENGSAARAAFKASIPTMTAFSWNMSHMTIHFLTRQCLQQGDAETSDILLSALWGVSSTLNQREWPRIFCSTLETVQMTLPLVLPFGWLSVMYVGSARWFPHVYSDTPPLFASSAQAKLLGLLQWLDWEIAAPDGQTRTCSGWKAEVERIAALVKERETLRPLSLQEIRNCYPTKAEIFRQRRVELVGFVGTTTPLLAWIMGWAFVLLLFYVLYHITASTFGSWIFDAVRSIFPQWLPGRKVLVAGYILLRIPSMVGTFPTQF